MKLNICILAIVAALCSASASVAAESADFASSQPTIDALTGTTLKCAVSPPTTLVYRENQCWATIQNSNYSVIYQVFTPAGGQYSYQWQVPSLRGQTVYTGCTSTSGICSLNVSRVGDHDNTIGVIVTDLATGQTVSHLASYSIPATCYNVDFGGWYWC